MLKVNTEALEQSLEKAKLEIKRKLENMVKEFTYKSIFIDNTPYGNSETYADLYNNPLRLKYFPTGKEGSAKAGWMVGVGEPSLDPYPSPESDSNALDAKAEAMLDAQEYKLGEKVYIANYVPYVGKNNWLLPWSKSLEGGASKDAPEGIRKPSIMDIQRIYQHDLQRMYND
jgi:hypothetical protein